jgi:hypothetical protein
MDGMNDLPKLTPEQIDQLCAELFAELVEDNRKQPPDGRNRMRGRKDGTISFGKFKDRSVATLPLNYLDWLLSTVRMDEMLRRQVIAAIESHPDRDPADQ